MPFPIPGIDYHHQAPAKRDPAPVHRPPANPVAIVKTVQKPDFRDRLAKMDADPLGESPDCFRRMLAQEIERWAKVVKLSKARPE